MSCIFVALHVPVYCVKNNVCIRPYQTDFKIHHVHVLLYIGKVTFSHMLFDIERELFLLKKSKENSLLS